MSDIIVRITKRPKQLPANVKDYGVVGDGVTNDTAAIQAAIDANGSVVFPEGDYLTDLITVTGTSKQIIGQGRVRLIQNDTAGVLSLTGGWDFTDTISSVANATVNTAESGETTSNSFVTQITTSGSHTITRGDVFKVVSDDLFTGVASTSSANDYRRGEYAIAATDSSASIITLSHVLQDSYTTAPRIGRLMPVRFTITGIDFDTSATLGASMDGVYSAAVTIRAAKDCELRNLRFLNQYGSGILIATYNPTIENCRFINLQNRPTVSHYGYGVLDISHGLSMSNCNGQNLRHLYSAGSNTVPTGSSSLEYFGGNQACVISNSVCSAPQSAGFDTHELARDITFDNCIVYGAYAGASSGGNAFTARGSNIVFNNCVAVRCKTGFNISTTGGAALNNCRALKTSNEALNVTGGSNLGSVTTLPNIRINGGYYEGGYNTGGVFSSMGSLGTTSYTSTVIMRSATFVLYGNITGTRLFDIRQCNLSMTDCTFDFSNYAGAFSWTGFSIRDNVSNVSLVRLDVIGGSSATTGLQIVNGFSAGCTSPVDVKDLTYSHASMTAAVVGTNMSTSVWRNSWVKIVGGTRTTSVETIYVPTAGGTIPIGNVNDPIVNVTFSGTPGNVTLGTVPTGLAGQAMQISNVSNGTIGCSGLPDFLIPPGGCGAFISVNGFWRPIATVHRMFMPWAAVTLSNGANVAVTPPGTIPKGFMRIAGPTAAFSVQGIASGVNGMVITLFNTTSRQMTISNEAAGATAANRITTLSGADVVLRAGNSFATLVYDGTTSRWILMSLNAPVTPPTLATDFSYTLTNVTTDRTLDADSTSIDELADFIATMAGDLEDLKSKVRSAGIIA